MSRSNTVVVVTGKKFPLVVYSNLKRAFHGLKKTHQIGDDEYVINISESYESIARKIRVDGDYVLSYTLIRGGVVERNLLLSIKKYDIK